MKKLLFFIFSLSLFNPFFADAQKSQTLDKKTFEEIKIIEDTLGALGFLMVNDSLPEHRFGSCKKFIPNLVKALKHKNSFNYPFDRLNTVLIMYPPDSTFRIFTWQLYVDKDTYHQYGAIQMNTSDLKLFRLLDRPSNPMGIEKIQLSADEWLGAIYYNIHQFETKDGPQYLLFGLDGKSFFQKRKVLDVLKFDNGKPVFGSPVFVKNVEGQPTTTQSRIILDYSAETSIRLNYDLHLEMIIFDHLISQPSPFPGEEFTYLPDGSYEGYKYENGQWVYVEKVFDHKYEDGEFPVPEPLSKKGEKKKNIFGQK